MNAKLLSAAVLSVSLASCGLDLPGKCGAPGPHSTAVLAAVTLANDCGSAKEAAAPSADFAGACLAGVPCGLCRQSSMQLQLTAFGRAVVKIQDVRLIDAKTGAVIEHLKPRDPQQWDGAQYVSWDETLVPTVVTKVSYKLSAPNYQLAADANGRFGYQTLYKVEMDVLIGDELHTVTGEATREPEVVT